ncbi:MAG: four helix bundle protein [Flavobacteriales bacterium]
MGYIYSFERLEVWQESRKLVKEVYIYTKDFPDNEKYGLTKQLHRASVSISSNIAEGSTRMSKREKTRFYEIAFGSLIEVLNQLIIANDLGYLNNKPLYDLRNQIEKIGRMLHSLTKSNTKKQKNQ